MDETITTAPILDGYRWRALAPGDSTALAGLAAACAARDGNPLRPGADAFAARLSSASESLASDTLCAAGEKGDLAAYAWLTFDEHLEHEYRAYLEGRVHPDWRGRGTGLFLLRWQEARALAVSADRRGSRPAVLRVDTYDERNPTAAALYARRGFVLGMAEEAMRRDLGPGAAPLPPVELPPDFHLLSWTGDLAPSFHEVYVAAFRERPGFPNLSLEQWRAMFTGFDAFRADLSCLLLHGDQPAGYTACAVDDAEDRPGVREGWIVQMGVKPEWRRQGLGRLLLVRALHDFAAENLPYAMLDVNLNNPGAAGLYRSLGFTRARLLSSYRKVIE
jgi:ribosomal protein S18 acetylase RimI-like enzyme